MMTSDHLTMKVSAVKDGSTQRPIPTAWRPVFSKVVGALAKHDYELKTCPPEVSTTPNTDTQIRAYIQSYGATLIELPQKSWDSSVCIWYENYWDVLTDLWTQEEGPSDLFLGARVIETDSGYSFQIQMVYVP